MFLIIYKFLYLTFTINFLQKYIYFFNYRKYFFYSCVNLKKIMKLQLKKICIISF